METRLTIIVTASISPSHPSIHFIKETIESLKYLNSKNYNVILAHDFDNSSSYLEYLDNLRKYVKTLENSARFKIIVNPTWGCLTGNLRHAINNGSIDTKYILVIQHDLPFIRDFDIEKIMDDMDNTEELKYVRFNLYKTIGCERDKRHGLFGKQVVANNYSYTRTANWTDNNHICTLEYYNNIVLQECKDGSYMERTLHRKSIDEITHAKYGTYIFGMLEEPPYIRHSNGRKWNGIVVPKK